jgi:hypothetical protein
MLLGGVRHIYPMKTKSEASARLKQFLREECAPRGIKVQVLRSDNGGEYIGSEFQAWCASHIPSVKSFRRQTVSLVMEWRKITGERWRGMCGRFCGINSAATSGGQRHSRWQIPPGMC